MSDDRVRLTNQEMGEAVSLFKQVKSSGIEARVFPSSGTVGVVRYERVRENAQAPIDKPATRPVDSTS